VSAGRRDQDIACEKKAHLRRLLDEQVAEKRAAVEAEKAEDIAVRSSSPSTITHAYHIMSALQRTTGTSLVLSLSSQLEACPRLESTDVLCRWVSR
jgi:hypothetical protein